MNRGDPILDLELDRFLPYLLNRTGARISVTFSDELRVYGIDLQMWRVLAALHHENGQRVSDLSDLTSIEISTLSRLLGRMEDANLVERHREADDMRGIRVDITHKGEGLTGALIPMALEYEAKALKGFRSEEIETFKAMLQRVFANMGRHSGDHPT